MQPKTARQVRRIRPQCGRSSAHRRHEKTIDGVPCELIGVKVSLQLSAFTCQKQWGAIMFARLLGTLVFALQEFYGSLTDEQKSLFNTLGQQASR
jgi:hypothetical protein